MAQLDQKKLNSEIYVWQRPEWPYFQWDSSALLDSLVKVRHNQGRLLALSGSLNSLQRSEVVFSDLEKDLFQNSESKLSKERICGWQASFFPTGFSGIHRITVGDYRKKDLLLRLDQKVPSALSLNASMNKFFDWWNDSPVGLDGIIRAGIAYFWFLAISPFEDGNLQVAQALVELALAQDEKRKWRSYSLTSFFENEKESLQQVIISCLKKEGDITPWLQWFFSNLNECILKYLIVYEKKAAEAVFSKKVENYNLNLRQKKILNFLKQANNLTYSISNRKCVEICQASRESIKRDLKKMLELDLIKRSNAKGRSITYQLTHL